MKALSTSKKPTRIIIVSVVAVILLGVGVYAYFATRSQDLPTNPPNTIKEEQVSSNTQSQSTLPSKSDKNPAGTNPQTPTETPSTPPEKPNIERASGDPIIKVVATFQKASSGSCDLQLSQPGQETVNHTSNITVSSSYYTCSFSIARSTLPAGGSWNATVIHRVGAASTASDVKVVE